MTAMDPNTKQAFQTPWALCTEEQRALREAWLPSRDHKAVADAYENELVRRFVKGEPLSKSDKQRARKILKARGTIQ